MGNRDLKKLSRKGGKKRGMAERKMLLNSSDIKEAKAIGEDRGNEVKDEYGTMRKGMILSVELTWRLQM